METIPKDKKKQKTKTNYKDDLNEDFVNFKSFFFFFKSHMIGEFKAVMSSFFVEVKQVKNQLSNKRDNTSTSSTLERPIVQVQEQISTFTEQLNRKD